MARICILLGAPTAKPDAPLSAVYVGRDASAMDAAAKASPFAVHYIVKNPPAIRKHNANAAANAAAAPRKGRRVAKAADPVPSTSGSGVTLQSDGGAPAASPASTTSSGSPDPAPTVPPVESAPSPAPAVQAGDEAEGDEDSHFG